MQLLRGSHLWANGLLQIPAYFHHQDMHEQRDVALNSMDGLTAADWEPVPAVLPAGGVSVHDWRTLHGSGPNHSGEMRMSLAVHMRTGRSRPSSTGNCTWTGSCMIAITAARLYYAMRRHSEEIY